MAVGFIFYELQTSLHGIFDNPLGIFIPAAAQLETLVSNAQANPALNQCLLWPHIAASETVAIPLKKKNSPMRMSADLPNIGARAYMWKIAIRVKAPKTPSERAITTGTPNLGRPYRKGP
jgi:hypothetical protein